MDTTVRVATPRDICWLADAWTEASGQIKSRRQFMSREPHEMVDAFIVATIDRMVRSNVWLYLIAENDGKKMGFLIAELGYGTLNIELVYVEEGYRMDPRHLGAMQKAALSWGRRNGAQDLTLETEATKVGTARYFTDHGMAPVSTKYRGRIKDIIESLGG